MEYHILKAREEDAEEIFAGIRAAGKEKGPMFMYYEDPDCYLSQIRQGYSAVAKTRGGELMAAFTATASTEDTSVYGYVSLREDEKPLLFDSVFVKPEYRGLGLQKSLAEKIMEYAGGRFTDGYTTIHPLNTPSMKNMKGCGFTVLRDDLMWEIGPRVLLHRFLSMDKQRK